MISRHPKTHTNGGFLPAGPVLSQWRSGVSGTFLRCGRSSTIARRVGRAPALGPEVEVRILASTAAENISRGGLGGPTNHKKGTIVFKYQAVLIVFGILTVAAAFRLLGALLEIALGRSWS